MDYQEASAIMATHTKNVTKSGGIVAARGNPNAKKLKNQTWLHLDVNAYSIRFFATEILSFNEDVFSINDGGYFSRSTHDRLNEYLPKGFRVYGATYPALQLKRPLGFIKTPDGVFPYSLPTTFRYDGSTAQWLTSRADAVIAKLPAYVDDYLDRLFQGRPCEITSKERALEMWSLSTMADAKNSQWDNISARIANVVLSGITYTHALVVVGDELLASGTKSSLEMTEFSDLATILIERGTAAAFKRPRTRLDKARRLEDVLAFGTTVPPIRAQILRAYFRKHLIRYIVEGLGFADVEWHRR